VHAVLEPARQIGGDLFEVLRLGPERVLVAIGDVSGKGIPAAMALGSLRSAFRAFAAESANPSRILRLLNDELLTQNPRGMFVTLQCLVFDLGARTVTCASGGHHGAVRVRPGHQPDFVFTSSGRVLGLMPAEEIVSETIPLQPGEALVLFTDGVSEAFNADDELFGDNRLLAQLETAERSARDMTLGVLDAVRRHAGGARQSDDITVLSVRYDGAS